MHRDGIQRGERVLLVDDLIATGGTAEAALKLVGFAGGSVVGCAFIVDLPDLGGRARLETGLSRAGAVPISRTLRSESHEHVKPSIADRRRTFHELHAAGCFVIPNPWDPGTARYLQSLGFKALATTSSGFAWSRARPDNGITRELALAHLADMVAATDLPVNADFEGGFAQDAAGVAESVRLAVETGVAGLSIEDSTGDAAQPLYELPSRPSGCARRAARSTRRAMTRCSWARRVLSRRSPRSCRDDRAAQGLFGRGRRLPLRAGHSHARADYGSGRRRRAEAREPADRLGERLDGRRGRRARRSKRERRRSAGAQRPGAASCAPRS